MNKYHSVVFIIRPQLYFSLLCNSNPPQTWIFYSPRSTFFSSSGLQIPWISSPRKFSFLSTSSNATGLQGPSPSYLSSRTFHDSVGSYLHPYFTIPKHLAFFLIISCNFIVTSMFHVCVTSLPNTGGNS